MSQTHKLGKHATSVYPITDKKGNLGTAVRYYSTVIVKVFNDRIELNSGGWRTATTKTRMNQAASQFGLDFIVTQRNFDWYVTTPDGKIIDFLDGMEFSR